jgi:hypothetical protein
MTRRGRAFVRFLLPLAIGALSLGVFGSDVAGAKDTPKKAGEPAPKRTQKTNRHHAAVDLHRARGPHPTLAIALGARNWTDYAEEQLGPPIAGAVCPAEMANVDDRFCIDRWEGSLVEMLSDGRDVPWPPFGTIEEGHVLRAVSAANVYPQAYISGAQAARACAAAGKRLCAPVEWRKACMGPTENKFGYGNDRISATIASPAAATTQAEARCFGCSPRLRPPGASSG